MRSSRWQTLTAAAALIGLTAVSGCATTGTTLSGSAQRLEHAATTLERNADSSRVRAEARDLAEESRDFRHAVNDRPTDRRDVRVAFDDLSHSYHELRDAVERANDRESERDFDTVTSVYLDIEREVNLNDRYATLN